MLTLLPVLVLVMLSVHFYGKQGREGASGEDWRGAFLSALPIWGALATAIIELLGLAAAISQEWLALSWGLVLVALLGLMVLRGTLSKAYVRLRQARWPLRGFESVLVAGLAAEALLLLVVAWISPPNNTDSLQYHMSRVAHWAQAGSLRHYATGFDPQLSHPIWAETAILNLRVLFGNDRPANLVQWLAMVSCLVAATSIADLLGARGRPQWIAPCFLASLPIGILEATSTQNDYVSGMWFACMAYFVMLCKKRELSSHEKLSLSLAVGLGILTKGTFYPYALPFLLWFFLTRTGQRGIWPTVREGLVLLAPIVLLNAGYWLRNLDTYGSPLGGVQGFFRLPAGPGALVLSWLDNVLLNFATPLESLNERIIQWATGLHAHLNGSAPPWNLRLTWGWNNENLAGNPLHLMLVAAVFLAAVVAARARKSPPLFSYAAATIAGALLLFSVMVFDEFGVRLQLPFFIACAPLVAAGAHFINKPRIVSLACVLLLLSGLPWILLNASRPLVGLRPRTMTESILEEDRTRVLFAGFIPLQEPYEAAAAIIRSSDCRDIGLRIDSHDLEYVWWWLLEAPQSGFRLETIHTYPWLERYVDPKFKPCIVVCTICDDRSRLHGLDLLEDLGPVSLFGGTGYTRDPDG